MVIMKNACLCHNAGDITWDMVNITKKLCKYAQFGK